MTTPPDPPPPAVPFNYAAWILGYPLFAGVSEPLAQTYYDRAGNFCANTICNPFYCDGRLGMLLNLLTAHIAWLNAPRDAQGNPATTGTQPSTLVGRISSASEGSVSVSTENQYAPGTPQWYQQSPWGSEFWAATAPTRTMRYAAQPVNVPLSLYPYAGTFGGRFGGFGRLR